MLLATFGEDLFALFIITCIYLQRNKKVEVEIAKIQTHRKLVVQIILTTANTSTWWQIAKKHVDFVKEEEEIAKIRMLNAQPGLHMGIAKNTRITCKKNAQKLAKFAEKNQRRHQTHLTHQSILVKFIVDTCMYIFSSKHF